MTSAHRNQGAALVIALIVLAVITVLAVLAVSTATLELRMAGNEQYQEQAFRAAEAGIEQAIAAGGFTTDPSATAARYDAPTSVDPIPRRGAGVPIAGCPAPSEPACGACEYFLRYDHATGATPVPGADTNLDASLRAYHFVVDAFGVAGRGACSHQVQGFFVVAASDTDLDARPVRSYWLQRGIDTG